MPRGYRCVILAALGWLILANGKAAEDKQGKATDPAASTSPTPTPTYSPFPYRDAEACYEAKDHDAADLCAQWRAAIAAEKAADASQSSLLWSGLAAIASILTIGGLIFTLRQTQDALKEARRGNRLNLLAERRARRKDREAEADTKAALTIADKNAEAATRLVEITEQNSQKQNRAYLVAHRPKLDLFSPILIRIVVPIANCGSTPARAIVVHRTLWIGPGNTIDPLKDGIEPARFYHFRDFLGSGTSDDITFSLLGEADIASIDGDKIDLYIYGRVDFEDVFGNAQWMTFAFRNDGGSIHAQSTFSTCIHGNDAS